MKTSRQLVKLVSFKLDFKSVLENMHASSSPAIPRAAASIEGAYALYLGMFRTAVVVLLVLLLALFSIRLRKSSQVFQDNPAMAAALKFLTVAPRATHTATVIFIHVSTRVSVPWSWRAYQRLRRVWEILVLAGSQWRRCLLAIPASSTSSGSCRMRESRIDLTLPQDSATYIHTHWLVSGRSHLLQRTMDSACQRGMRRSCQAWYNRN